MKIAVDANLLVYSDNTSSPYYQVCREFLLKERDNLVVANQTLFEFVRVVTHPQYPKRLPIKTALDDVIKYSLLFEIVYESEKDLATFQILCEKYKLGSNRVFDTKLVATLMNNGISQLATINEKDFSVFKEIKVINPVKLKKSKQ